MRSWVEAILAISVTAILGASLFFYSGGSLTDETPTEPTIPITVDSQSAARGEILSVDAGCIACHSADGTPGTGPTWKGVAGATRPLDTGESVIADDVYLFRSITDPGAQTVAGYENVMPFTFGDTLSDQEISDLVEYVLSL